ncbi:MAG: DUF4235 domain-containing protein [Candidatus Nanopelagicales bacterium]|nr:DUF4235 domain-containing protein [Candidatus Nanopelagicales bacterium]
MSGKEILRFSAPLIAMSGVWVVRRAFAAGYEAATGNTPPDPDDLNVPLGKALLFATATAVTASVVSTLVSRGIAKITTEPEALPQA